MMVSSKQGREMLVKKKSILNKKIIFESLYCIYVAECRHNFTPRQNTYLNQEYLNMYVYGSCSNKRYDICLY